MRLGLGFLALALALAAAWVAPLIFAQNTRPTDLPSREGIA
ncbi:hypothetical protein ABIE69_001057 [Rhodobacteraceae bacterium MBR-64]